MPTAEPRKPPEGSASGTNPRYPALIGIIGIAAASYLVSEVQRWEGYSEVPYADVVKVNTVCWGDTKDVRPGLKQTREQCEARLERQLIAHAKPVLQCVPGLKDRPNQLAAAVSLAYNIGTAAFCKSTAAKRFNAGNWRGGCDAFLAWRFAGGREFKGLLNRRKSERAICLRGLS